MTTGDSNNLNTFEIKGLLSGRYNFTCDVFRQNYDNCLNVLSEENVHDLRVSIRRLIAFLSLQRSLFNSGYYKRLIKQLRKLLKELSSLRDIQVQLLNLRDKRHNDKFIMSYFYFLLKSEESEVNRISEYLYTFSPDEINSMLFFLQNDFKIKFSVYPGLKKDLKHRLTHTFNKIILCY